MSPAYAIRAGGDPVHIRNKKQSMADLKLRRLTELNLRLREDLDRPRVKLSEAAMGCVIVYFSSFHPIPSISSSYLLSSQLLPTRLFGWMCCILALSGGRNESQAQGCIHMDANENDNDRLITYTNQTKDFMVPQLWGPVRPIPSSSYVTDPAYRYRLETKTNE